MKQLAAILTLISLIAFPVQAKSWSFDSTTFRVNLPSGYSESGGFVGDKIRLTENGIATEVHWRFAAFTEKSVSQKTFSQASGDPVRLKNGATVRPTRTESTAKKVKVRDVEAMDCGYFPLETPISKDDFDAMTLAKKTCAWPEKPEKRG